RVFGGKLSRRLMSPAANPVAPAGISRRRTTSRVSCARASNTPTASNISIVQQQSNNYPRMTIPPIGAGIQIGVIAGLVVMYVTALLV
ncbi:MAG: hypothetical protein ACE5FM_09045, partial [Methyloligellaceae bacterium]